MKKIYYPVIFLVLLIITIFTPSCKKFLDEKADKKLVLPSTLTDLWAIMDYSNVMIINDPYVDELSADNFYLLPAYLNNMAETDRNLYVWNNSNLYVQGGNSWMYLYSKIYYANTVLGQLEKIERTALNQQEWDHLKGHALMVRGKALLQGVLIWAKAYDPATAAVDMGIPLRLNTNFEEPSVRSSVEQTYARIIHDLQESVKLLPVVSSSPIRANKPAAFAFLARTQLCMYNYDAAGKYADSSLLLYSNLLDYNNVNANANFPIPRLNTEILFFTSCFNAALSVSNARIDSVLYNSYQANDLRKKVFFRQNTDGTFGFKGTYTSATGNFPGIATDEVYLMKAEVLARKGQKDSAINVLNKLLANRYNRLSFVPVTASSAGEALQVILAERRKELVFRGLRWMDLKRLNKEGANIILKRKFNNVEYTLLPNSNRYALPIPEYVIQIAHIPQNP